MLIRNKSNSKKIIFSFLIILNYSIFQLYSQYTINLEELIKKYNSNAVMLNSRQEILIDIFKDSVYVNQHNVDEIAILSDHAKAFSNNNLTYSSFSKIKNLNAKTFVPSKKGYKIVNVTGYTEKNNSDASVFYDDVKEINFTFPAIQKGCILYSDYTIEYLNPRFLRNFYLQSYIPVVTTTLQIKVNKDIEIGFAEFNMEGVTINFTKEEQGKYTLYTWTANDLKPYKIGENHANISYYSPHLVYYLKKARLNGLTIKYFDKTEALYSFYYSYIQHLNKSNDEILRSFVQDLTKKIDDPQDKVRKILYWVQDNIKYIAYEQGMRGFIPNNASKVFNKRYGDCKDMSSLLVQMLNYAGIKAHLSWIGTRSIPYKYSELALPQTDNHMVATYINLGIPYILDGTIDHLPFGYPPDHIQGKDLLVGIDEKHFEVFEVPVMNESFSGKSDTSYIYLSGDTLKGEAINEYRGYERMNLSYIIEGQKKDELQKRLTRVLAKGHNKYFITDFSISNEDLRDIPVEIKYNFNILDYINNNNDEIYINLNIDKSYNDSKVDSSLADVPLENEYLFKDSYCTIFKIPEGYSIEYLPENTNFEKEMFGFKIKYELQENKIIQTKEIQIKFLILDKKYFNDWNEMIKQINSSYRESVVIKKNKVNS